MANDQSKSGEGRQPEALRTFEDAARSGSVKPADQGLSAKPETAPGSKDLAGQQAAAAEVLNEGGEEKRTTTHPAAKDASEG